MDLFRAPWEPLIEKVTSENLPVGSEDVELSLEIADKIKSKQFPAKSTAQFLKKRINHKNPNVQILTLKLVDFCVKNAGHHFVVEVASREFSENLSSLVRAYSTNKDVKDKILALVQAWGIAFKPKSELSTMVELYETLKREGFGFPAVDRALSSSVMIETQTAPEWSDSDVCMRCRTEFTLVNRKHHCRNCGQTFCQACSSKSLPLPHLGLTQEVRVCDSCHFKLLLKTSPNPDRRNTLSGFNSLSTTPPPAPANSSNEDEELQRAIQLSLKEANQKVAEPYHTPAPSKHADSEDEDEDLKAAIEASLKEVAKLQIAQSEASRSSAPSAPAFNAATNLSTASQSDLSNVEEENLRLFAELVERVEQEVAVRGLGVFANNPQIQLLYGQISAIQPKLMGSLDDTAQKYRQVYELHEKLIQGLQTYDHLLQQRLSGATSVYGLYGSAPVAAPSRSYGAEYGGYGTQPLAAPPNQYDPAAYARAGYGAPEQQLLPVDTSAGYHQAYAPAPDTSTLQPPPPTEHYNQPYAPSQVPEQQPYNYPPAPGPEFFQQSAPPMPYQIQPVAPPPGPEHQQPAPQLPYQTQPGAPPSQYNQNPFPQPQQSPQAPSAYAHQPPASFAPSVPPQHQIPSSPRQSIPPVPHAPPHTNGHYVYAQQGPPSQVNTYGTSPGYSQYGPPVPTGPPFQAEQPAAAPTQPANEAPLIEL
ncbi:putative vacuolar sorting-associated protein [Cladochytrium replicatum]|nr:putative vacuolar sorting-associated protein [Cladochytrium replicatum]